MAQHLLQNKQIIGFLQHGNTDSKGKHKDFKNFEDKIVYLTEVEGTNVSQINIKSEYFIKIKF